MAITTFTPPVNPAVGMQHRVKPRTLVSAFGDGYTQRFGDGINTMPRELSLSWGPISRANADVLESFFEARGGIECFYYTTPLDLAAGKPARKYICNEWTRKSSNTNFEEVQANFIEVFDLGA